MKLDLMALLKIEVGLCLLLLTGGWGLVILGLLPAGAVIAIIGLLTLGSLTAADLATLSAIGMLYILISLPIAFYSVGLIDSGLHRIFGKSIGVRKYAKKGAEMIPIIGKPLGSVVM